MEVKDFKKVTWTSDGTSTGIVTKLPSAGKTFVFPTKSDRIVEVSKLTVQTKIDDLWTNWRKGILNLRITWVSFLNLSLKTHADANAFRQVIQNWNRGDMKLLNKVINPPRKSHLVPWLIIIEWCSEETGVTSLFAGTLLGAGEIEFVIHGGVVASSFPPDDPPVAPFLVLWRENERRVWGEP